MAVGRRRPVPVGRRTANGGAYGVYRQTIITGSVIGACQRLFFQGWNSVVFVVLILGIPVLCVFLAISFLAPGDRH
jgi:hypothetical protein